MVMQWQSGNFLYFLVKFLLQNSLRRQGLEALNPPKLSAYIISELLFKWNISIGNSYIVSTISLRHIYSNIINQS